MLKQNNLESLSASGPISIATQTTALFATLGSLTMTLPAPTQDLQTKVIQLCDATHTATVATANIQGSLSTPITLSAAGDTLVLLSLGGQWVPVSGSGYINAYLKSLVANKVTALNTIISIHTVTNSAVDINTALDTVVSAMNAQITTINSIISNMQTSGLMKS